MAGSTHNHYHKEKLIMDALIGYGSTFVTIVVYSIVAVALLWISKVVRDFLTPFDDDELIGAGNLALALRRGGFYLAFIIGLTSAVDVNGGGYVDALVNFATQGAFLLVLLSIVGWWNDKVVLSGLDNSSLVEKNNTAVGLVEAGSFIATGLIISGANSGTGGGLEVTIGFVVLAQLALLGFYKLYEALTKFKAKELVSQGNNSAGLALGGLLVSLGWILRSCVAGDFTSWSTDTVGFLAAAVIGSVALLIVRALIDIALVRKQNMHQAVINNNIAAVTVVQFGVFSVALFISQFI